MEALLLQPAPESERMEYPPLSETLRPGWVYFSLDSEAGGMGLPHVTNALPFRLLEFVVSKLSNFGAHSLKPPLVAVMVAQ